MFSTRLLLKAGSREQGQKLYHSEVRESGGRLSRGESVKEGLKKRLWKACQEGHEVMFPEPSSPLVKGPLTTNYYPGYYFCLQ